MRRRMPTVLKWGSGIALAVIAALAIVSAMRERKIVVASATTVPESGLLSYLLPAFTKETGIAVEILPVGTGRALSLARKGEADVVLGHDPNAEFEFMADGFGTDLREVMYDDFVLVGPDDDPAKIADSADVLSALRKIAAAQAPFVTRIDNSATYNEERRLWKEAGIERMPGYWYLASGGTTASALRLAASKNAYTLADHATWLNLKPKNLKVLVEGDRRLANYYAVMLVNPEKHPDVNWQLGRVFVDWLTSPEGQQLIADYRVHGQRVFVPNFRRPTSGNSLLAGLEPTDRIDEAEQEDRAGR